jgi:hypothetical protein
MGAMNISQYAEHRGVDRKTVRYAVQTGRITRSEDGTINSDQADEDWDNNTDPSKAMNGKARHGQDDDPPARPNPVDDMARSTQALYMKARASREMHQSELARLDYEKRKGNLVPRAEANMWIANYFAMIRNACEQIPHRLSGQLAAETDTETIFELLEEEIRGVFHQFANGKLGEGP